MVVETDFETDRIFRALADATRRDILRRTLVAEVSVSALAADYAMSFAAVQKHVAVLAAAELVVKRAEGRERLVRADPAVIGRARLLLERYEQLWRSRIGRLDDLLAADTSAAAAPPPPGAAAASAPPPGAAPAASPTAPTSGPDEGD